VEGKSRASKRHQRRSLVFTNAVLRSDTQYTVVNYLLPKFEGFFPAFLATGLPAAFLIGNALVKRFVFKQTDFHFFGGDMVFCGSVLFTSTLLRELSLDHLPSGTRNAVYFVMALVFFMLWLLVLAMGRRKIRWLSVCAAIMAMLIFSCCSLATWSMLSTRNVQNDRGTTSGSAS
jgi:hypothetical protein